MRKFLKFLLSLLLLPTAAGLSLSIGRLLVFSPDELKVIVPIVAGATCWGVVFWLLPRPMWTYVLGHELTHVIWIWLFGGGVKRMAVTAQGGQVVTNRSNFLICLAPYFFPFYAILVAVGYWALGLRLEIAPFRPWFHLALGAAYAFHVTMTLEVLQTRQPDLAEHGFIFSAVIIYLGNALTVLLALALLLDPGEGQASLRAAAQSCVMTYRGIAGWVMRALGADSAS